MKLKKILLQLGLLLAFVGVGMAGVNTAEAAGSNPSGVDADATKLSGASFDNNRDSPNYVNDVIQDSWYGINNYPEMPSGVYANGVENGRVTTKTTKFFLKYTQSGNGSNPEIKNGSLISFYPDIMHTDSVHSTSLVKNSVTSWPISGKKVTSIPSGWTELDVDLTNLGKGLTLPIYIGFTANYGTNLYNRYYWVSLKSDPDAVAAMGDLTIDGGGTVSSSASKITGTGKPGLTVSLSSVSGTHTATVQADGKYTIDLGSDTLKSLKAGNQITVTEYSGNEFGDSKDATAKVVPTVPLSMTATTPTVAVDPDTLSANITGKSDADILKWLASSNAAGLTTIKEGSTTPLSDSDGLTYTADSTDLATSIATATATKPLTINVSASDSAGDKTTSTTPISVYATDGIFKFNSLTDFEFGSFPVPAQETLFAPTKAPSILLDDTQTVGRGWTVTANATTMTMADGDKSPLNGKLVYVDADGNKQNMTGTAVEVGSGKRESGATTADVAKGWASGNAIPGSAFDKGSASGTTQGIYLDAQPNIYAGELETDKGYTGSIAWVLRNTPQ